jgi:hypothetical protein
MPKKPVEVKVIEKKEEPKKEEIVPKAWEVKKEEIEKAKSETKRSPEQKKEKPKEKEKDKEKEEVSLERLNFDEIIEEEADEKPEGKKIKEETPIEKTGESSSPSSPFSSFARHLSEQGVLPEFDSEEFSRLEEDYGGVEALSEMMKKTIGIAVAEYKSNIDEDLRDIIEAREQGLPIDELKKVKSKKFEFTSISNEKLEEDLNLQKKLVAEDLRMRNFTQEEIDEEITGYEDLGKLETKSKKALENLKKHVETEEKQVKERAEHQKKEIQKSIEFQTKKLKTEIENLDEIIPGRKITKPMKEKIFKGINEPVDYDDYGRPINSVAAKWKKDPVKFDILLSYLDQMGVLDWKFDYIINESKSEAVKDLKKSLESEDFKIGGSKAKPKNKGLDNDIASLFKTANLNLNNY